MAGPVDDLQEWMTYLGGRHLVVVVCVDLGPRLSDELQLRAGEVPAGYPRLCRLSLTAAAVPDPVAIGIVRRDAGPGWTRLFVREIAAAAGMVPGAARGAWGARFGASAAAAHRWLLGMAEQRPALGDGLDGRADLETRISRVGDAAATLFDRMWVRHAARIAGEPFRTTWLVHHQENPGVLRNVLWGWLRDDGSHTITVDEATGAERPLISGTQVKVITTLLRLSEQVRLDHMLQRLLGLDPQQAAILAKALVEEPDGLQASPAWQGLVAAWKRRGQVVPRGHGFDSDTAAMRLAILRLALHDPAPPGTAEDKRAAAHVEAVTRLCQGRGYLPKTAAVVGAKLRAYSGREWTLVSLDAPLGEDGTLADVVPAAEHGQDPVATARGFLANQEMFDIIDEAVPLAFPDDATRRRAAILLAFPDFLPAGADDILRQRITRLNLDPPKEVELWEWRAQQCAMTIAEARAERRRLEARLAKAVQQVGAERADRET